MFCGKIQYHTKITAQRDALFILHQAKHFTRRDKLNNRKKGKPLHPYECPRCGYWHLTSEPQRKKSKKKGK